MSFSSSCDRAWLRGLILVTWLTAIANRLVYALFVCLEACPAFGSVHHLVEKPGPACFVVRYAASGPHMLGVMLTLRASFSKPVCHKITVVDPECLWHSCHCSTPGRLLIRDGFFEVDARVGPVAD